MSQRLLSILALFSLVSIGLLYLSGHHVVDTLSPQGCRMSWMSPSYVLQSGFNTSWTSLANRYSLWLYREVGWEQGHKLHGQPVLFIPGNAGSSHQVRSIASSATRQYFSTPYRVSDQFTSGDLKPLDFFAVEFNEDLSAFHGPTLESEKQYTSAAISYILSLYPPDTSVIVLGHSMGGIVATSLLPHAQISSIITMSTPHTLPPARFDSRLDHIYANNLKVLQGDTTPILSLCGGATDLMVPSESCILPESEGAYRRTVFSSALEGSWTGVGHKEMVWCHQVRWRVARAALELGSAGSPKLRGQVLDTWLRDGSTLPPALKQHQQTVTDITLQLGQFVTLRENEQLKLRDPNAQQTYLLPVPRDDATKTTSKFVLYLSRGSIPPTSPHHSLPLHATVRLCEPSSSGEDMQCTPLTPSTLKLIPNPIPGRTFPVPGEGSDESEGVVFFETVLDTPRLGKDASVSVSIEGADGRGWVVGGFVNAEAVVNGVGRLTPFISSVSIDLSRSLIYHEISLPGILSHTLVVYKLTPHFESACTNSFLPPLLQHTSHPSESHYFPLSHSPPRNVLLHTHASAPYITTSPSSVRLSIYTTGECALKNVEIGVDWWGTLGRVGMRYWSAVLSWSVGLVAWMICDSWNSGAGTGPSLDAAFSDFVQRRLPIFAGASIIISLLPLHVSMWLGNGGQPIFVLLAPFLLLIVTGLVAVSWWVLKVSIWVWRAMMQTLPFGKRSSRRPALVSVSRRNWLISMAVIFLIIFVVVPWQVAYLGCWIFQYYITITSETPIQTSGSPSAIPLMSSATDQTSSPTEDQYSDVSPINTAHANAMRPSDVDRERQSNECLLLLMTWLLPLAAPVLAVWVRTLATAGLTTPFDGDHNFLYVAPFVVLLDLGPGVSGFLCARSEHVVISPRWAFLLLSVVSFLFGPRSTYVVFYTASAVFGLMLFIELVPRYWTGERHR